MTSLPLENFFAKTSVSIEEKPKPESVKKELEPLTFSPETPRNLTEAYLISASYDGEKGVAYVRLYEPKTHRFYFWYDTTGHKPYCLSDLPIEQLQKNGALSTHGGLNHFEAIKKYDTLRDKEAQMTKIVAKDPLAIGGRPSGCIRDIIPKAWEADIRYYENFIYDRRLAMGMPYQVKDGDLIPIKPDVPSETLNELRNLFTKESKEFQEYIETWANLFECQVPEFRRVALDIEVATDVPSRVPDPHEAAYPVVCATLLGSDGVKRVLLLRRLNVQEGSATLPSDVRVEYYDDEAKLITEIFKALLDYPIVLSFNGDDFDLRYLYHRAEGHLHFPREQIPIELGREFALLKYGVHIDLYKFFFNRSLQIYAFSQKYRENTLDAVGEALLGMTKLELRLPLPELPYMELANYCYRDAEITMNLTTHGNDLVMKLLVIFSRISQMPIEDVNRQGVSGWIRSLLYYEHRRRNYLIPRPQDLLELKGITTTEAITKGKKYKGAIVIPPSPGVHFNVPVLDFASVDSDEPIIVRREGEEGFHQVKIAEFVDNLLPSCDVAPLQVAETKHWEVLCFDKDGKVKFKPITQVSRHKWQESLLKIRTSDGRSLRVTPNHSLFRLNENLEVVPVKVGELRRGDYIIIPKKVCFPIIYRNKINLLDLLKTMPEEKTEPLILIYNYNRLSTQWRKSTATPLQKIMAEKLYYRDPQSRRLIFRFNDLKPYLHLIPPNELRNWGIYLKGKKFKMRGTPCSLVLSLENFAKFLGYYLSEGSICSTNDSIIIAQEKSPRISEDIFDCLMQLGFPFSRQRVGVVLSKSHFLSYLLAICLGAGRDAYTKAMPPFLFFTDEVTKMAFLKAYFNGDGWNYDSGYAFKTSSKRLANDLTLFLLSLGKNGITIDEKSEKIDKPRKRGKRTITDQVVDYTVRVNDNWDDFNITHNRHPSYLFPTTLLPQAIRESVPCKASENTKKVKFLEDFCTSLKNLDNHLLERLPDEATVSLTEDAQQLIRNHLNSRYGTWWNKLSKDERKTIGACLYQKTVKVNKLRLCSNIIELSSGELDRYATSFRTKHGTKPIGYPIDPDWEKLYSFLSSDLQISKVEEIQKCYPTNGYVYDLGVSETNSFISGLGWICAHNSLYPSIIKKYNLSYETVLCPHPECRDNKIPETPHWVCRKRRGLYSLIIGSLRDMRVKWYKKRAKDKALPEAVRNLYNVVQLTLKVFLNASYGVMGAEAFALYCPPVAEATAAIGRYAITHTIEKANSLGIKVLYGDTDSIFLEAPTSQQIDELMKWSEEELGMELEIDKVYRYSVFSMRKKNYLGVLPDGSVDIKGLTGKKRHIPEFLKREFMEMVKTLSQVQSPEDFEEARQKIRNIVKTCYTKIKNREYSLQDLSFNIMISKPPERYVKTTPIHVKAAKLLVERGIEIKPGDIIGYVKVVGAPGVKPVQLASVSEIDVDKYVEYIEATFEQVLDAIGLDFHEILGLTRLEYFMGN